MPAFFCTCTDVPDGYYNIWVRDDIDDQEYWRYFTNQQIAENYTHVLTLNIDDKEFERYMAVLYEEVYEGSFFPGFFRRIDDLSDPQKWVEGFPVWKQERERQRREDLLSEYYKKARDKEPMKS